MKDERMSTVEQHFFTAGSSIDSSAIRLDDETDQVGTEHGWHAPRQVDKKFFYLCQREMGHP